MYIELKDNYRASFYAQLNDAQELDTNTLRKIKEKCIYDALKVGDKVLYVITKEETRDPKIEYMTYVQYHLNVIAERHIEQFCKEYKFERMMNKTPVFVKR